MRIHVTGMRPEHAINGLEVDPNESIEGLYRRVAERLNEQPERLRLIFRGRLLTGSHPVSTVVEDGNTIHVVVPMRQQDNTVGSDSGAGGIENITVSAGVPSQAVLQEIITGIIPVLQSSALVSMQESPSVVILNSHSRRPSQSGDARQSGEARPTVQMQRVPPQRGTSQRLAPQAPQPRSPTSPASLHIHVHVTLNELDELPDRLERLRGRVRFPGINLQTHVDHFGGGGEGSAGASSHVGGEHGGNPNDLGTNNSNDDNIESAEGRDPNTLPEGSGVEENAPRIADSMMQALGDTHQEQERIVEGLCYACLRVIMNGPSSSLLRLSAGDWSGIAASRSAFVTAALHWLADGAGVAPLMCRENSRLHANRDTEALLNFLHECSELCAAIEEESRPDVNIFSDVRRFLLYMHEELFSAIVSSNLTDEEWTRALRTVVVRAAGILVSRSSIWFTRPLEGLACILAKSADTYVRRRHSETSPVVAQFLRASVPLLCDALREWSEEYQSHLRRELDSQIFEEIPATTPHGSDEVPRPRLPESPLARVGAAASGARANTENSVEGVAISEASNFASYGVGEGIQQGLQRFCHESPSGGAGERFAILKQPGD
ncbi:putative ubiquitin-like protein [Trypanosoma vivax]|nr:putative ubiquitin-like protein [Trypanosoma vivax]